MSITYFNSINDDVTEYYQWGLFQELEITGVSTSPLPTVHFMNGCCNTVYEVTPDLDESTLLVAIPNEVFEDWGSVLVWIYQDDGEGNAVLLDKVRIPVKPHVKPDDYEEIIEEATSPGGRLWLSIGRLDQNVLG